jgi:hypothetical protein
LEWQYLQRSKESRRSLSCSRFFATTQRGAVPGVQKEEGPRERKRDSCQAIQDKIKAKALLAKTLLSYRPTGQDIGTCNLRWSGTTLFLSDSNFEDATMESESSGVVNDYPPMETSRSRTVRVLRLLKLINQEDKAPGPLPQDTAVIGEDEDGEEDIEEEDDEENDNSDETDGFTEAAMVDKSITNLDQDIKATEEGNSSYSSAIV